MSDDAKFSPPRASLQDAEYSARKIARDIKAAMPRGWGFVLVLATHGDGGDMTYVSSLERAGAITMLSELVASITVDGMPGGRG